MEIFSDFFGSGGGGEMLGRYVHFLAGRHLDRDALLLQLRPDPGLRRGQRRHPLRGACGTITWRALWWFRFGALLTFLSGIWILGIQKHLG